MTEARATFPVREPAWWLRAQEFKVLGSRASGLGLRSFEAQGFS